MATSIFTTAPCDICAKGLRVGNRYFVTSRFEDTKPTDCCSIQCVADWATSEEKFMTEKQKLHVYATCEQCGKRNWVGLKFSVIIHGPADDVEADYLCSSECAIAWVNEHNNDDSLYYDDEEFYDEDEDDWDEDEDEDEEDEDDD